MRAFLLIFEELIETNYHVGREGVRSADLLRHWIIVFNLYEKIGELREFVEILSAKLWISLSKNKIDIFFYFISIYLDFNN